MENFKIGYTTIPNFIIHNKVIKSSEYRLYSILCSFNPSYPSYKRIQELTGFSSRTVASAMARLETRTVFNVPLVKVYRAEYNTKEEIDGKKKYKKLNNFYVVVRWDLLKKGHKETLEELTKEESTEFSNLLCKALNNPYNIGTLLSESQHFTFSSISTLLLEQIALSFEKCNKLYRKNPTQKAGCEITKEEKSQTRYEENFSEESKEEASSLLQEQVLTEEQIKESLPEPTAQVQNNEAVQEHTELNNKIEHQPPEEDECELTNRKVELLNNKIKNLSFDYPEDIFPGEEGEFDKFIAEKTIYICEIIGLDFKIAVDKILATFDSLVTDFKMQKVRMRNGERNNFWEQDWICEDGMY